MPPQTDDETPPGASATPAAPAHARHTGHIRVLGHGRSADGARFVELELREAGEPTPVLVRTDNLLGRQGEEFSRLNRLGAHLLTAAAQRELMDRLQADRPSGAAFHVATRLGWAGGAFVLPDEVIGAGGAPTRRHLAELPADQLAGYRTGGTLDGARQLFALARGNSRFQLAAALALVGPLAPLVEVAQVGVQLTGWPGSGKTALGCVVSAIWGRSPDPARAAQYGFGVPWHNTLNKLEALAPAHQNGFLFLDDTRRAPRAQHSQARTVLDAAMQLEGGVSKGRLDGRAPHAWQLALLSTSNLSLDQMAAAEGVPVDDAYRDRLIDVPPPTPGVGFFEDLHGAADLAGFVGRLKALAAQHFGLAIRRFLHGLAGLRQRYPDRLVGHLATRRREYLELCSEITAPGRDLGRLHQKLATVYAAGCLGIGSGLFDWTREELAQSLLRCTRDHVALVAAHAPDLRDPLRVLCDYVTENEHGFQDVRDPRQPAPGPHEGCPGYVAAGSDGAGEYLFAAARFEAILGGPAAARAARQALLARGLLATTTGGPGQTRFVVKRTLGRGADGQPVRAYVLAVSARLRQAVQQG